MTTNTAAVISSARCLSLVKANQMESANRAARSLPYQDDAHALTHTPQMICHNPSSSVTIKGPMERSAGIRTRERGREAERKGRKGNWI